jgi:hypothetical protein
MKRYICSITCCLLLSIALFAQTSGSITQGLVTTTTADLMPNCPSNHTTAPRYDHFNRREMVGGA